MGVFNVGGFSDIGLVIDIGGSGLDGLVVDGENG